MAKLGKITVLATAAEAARQWAKNNPDKAQAYIDKAGSVVDKQTKGKYSQKITKASTKAKEAVAKGSSAIFIARREISGLWRSAALALRRLMTRLRGRRASSSTISLCFRT